MQHLLNKAEFHNLKHDVMKTATVVSSRAEFHNLKHDGMKTATVVSSRAYLLVVIVWSHVQNSIALLLDQPPCFPWRNGAHVGINEHFPLGIPLDLRCRD